MSLSRAVLRFAALIVAVLPMRSALGQDSLFMPRSIKRAFANHTRQADGRPGPRYWQNRARYTIDVAVTPPDRAVHGSEQITYYNDSPDTLPELVIKLFMNIHKASAPRNIGMTPDYITSGVHVESFTVNGAAVPWQDAGSFTSVPVRLATPLLPRDSVRLAFRWQFDLAKQPAREGVIDSTTFYLAYFYPRVAVYDDYNGWDTMDFTDLQEFYNDFSDYDVTLRVPANFVVWGTGTLTNAGEVLRPVYLQRFTSSMSSDSTIRVATRQDMASGAVTTAGSGNSWHFIARSVSDVAFGLSDHYDWDAASVAPDLSGARRVSVQAAYNDSAADFHTMVQMARQSLAFLSKSWPGVAYPYEKTTVFQGGAGMEYPMMVNDESYPDTTTAHFVAGHEIAHTWMPFYMGINETRYAFMDEGWATTFEYLLNEHNMGTARAVQFFQQFRVSPWAHDPSPASDLPIITPADAVRGATYRMNAYGKASLGYLAMKDYLGDATFRRALHAYMDRWNGKHPTPWDFFNSFNDASGRDLNWFWTNWYFTTGHIDISIRTVSKVAGGYSVALDNVGGFDAPVDLVLTFSDGTSQTMHETIGIWREHPQRANVTVRAGKTLRSVQLSGGIWMDTDNSNDRWESPSGTGSEPVPKWP